MSIFTLIVLAVYHILMGVCLGILFCMNRLRRAHRKTGRLIDEMKTDEDRWKIQGRLDLVSELL